MLFKRVENFQEMEQQSMLITEILTFDLSPLKHLFLEGSNDSSGTIMLRIHEPSKQEPIEPFIKYKF